jgi:hypothetical protein
MSASCKCYSCISVHLPAVLYWSDTSISRLYATCTTYECDISTSRAEYIHLGPVEWLSTMEYLRCIPQCDVPQESQSNARHSTYSPPCNLPYCSFRQMVCCQGRRSPAFSSPYGVIPRVSWRWCAILIGCQLDLLHTYSDSGVRRLLQYCGTHHLKSTPGHLLCWGPSRYIHEQWNQIANLYIPRHWDFGTLQSLTPYNSDYNIVVKRPIYWPRRGRWSFVFGITSWWSPLAFIIAYSVTLRTLFHISTTYILHYAWRTVYICMAARFWNPGLSFSHRIW